MATKPSIKVPVPRRTVSVHLLEPDVVELSLRGHVSDRSIEYARTLLLDLLLDLPRMRYFLVDTTTTDGYDESVRVPGVLLLRELRERGLERGVAVTDLSVRMVGSALSFVAAVPVDFLPTREQAIARLEAHRREG